MKFMKLIILLAIIATIFVLFAGCGAKSGDLFISVTDSGGNPLWGAKVVSESQPAGQLKIDGITSQEVGGVVFNAIKAGNYQVQVSRYDYAPETLEVSVPAGKTGNVVVKLFSASPPVT
jgi:hypothetical protein